MLCTVVVFFFFFNDTATTEIYTLSLHDALPILQRLGREEEARDAYDAGIRQAEKYGHSGMAKELRLAIVQLRDRKSTRLNSSHANISYAVFCLKKKKKKSYIKIRTK